MGCELLSVSSTSSVLHLWSLLSFQVLPSPGRSLLAQQRVSSLGSSPLHSRTAEYVYSDLIVVRKY